MTPVFMTPSGFPDSTKVQWPKLHQRENSSDLTEYILCPLTLYTVHCTLQHTEYPVRCTLYTVHCSIQSILYAVQCSLYTVAYRVSCTLYSVPSILQYVQRNLHTVYCTVFHVRARIMYNFPRELYHVQCTMFLIRCTLYPVHCAMYTFPYAVQFKQIFITLEIQGASRPSFQAFRALRTYILFHL